MKTVFFLRGHGAALHLEQFAAHVRAQMQKDVPVIVVPDDCDVQVAHVGDGHSMSCPDGVNVEA